MTFIDFNLKELKKNCIRFEVRRKPELTILNIQLALSFYHISKLKRLFVLILIDWIFRWVRKIKIEILVVSEHLRLSIRAESRSLVVL